MTHYPHTLSKSDFKLAMSCPTKLYYREKRYPDNLADDPYLQMLAEGGYMVEQLAKQLFDDGVTLNYRGGAEKASAETMQYLNTGEPVTLFEATLLEGLRLARVDILRRSASGFDLYEVKSSTFDSEDADKRISKTGSAFKNLTRPHGINSKWIEYLQDVAYQYTILRDLFPDVPVRAHLILVNKSVEVPFDGMPDWFRILRSDDGRLHSVEFIGDPAKARESKVVVGFDVTAEVTELEADVRANAEKFAASLSPQLTRIEAPLGSGCRQCEFRLPQDVEPNGFLECWGERGLEHPHVLDLYRGAKLSDELIARGISGYHDIPDEVMAAESGVSGEQRRRHVKQNKLGQEWIGSGLSSAVSRVKWPLRFLDFEAAQIALPHHHGMKPYGKLAFQWSCHIQNAPGEPLSHHEYLNDVPEWPNEDFARSLRNVLGDDGTILVWSHYENSVLNGIAEDLSAVGRGDEELADWLRSVLLIPAADGGRQLDMLPLCRNEYYHPAMVNSYSIKAVLDAVWKSSPFVRERFTEITGLVGDSTLGPYAALSSLSIGGMDQRVAEGTGAMKAYFAMVYGVDRDDPGARAAWRKLLLKYCELDTLAMVLIWEYWGRVTE